MERTEMIKWANEHRYLLLSTQQPSREEAEMIFKIANQVDTKQTHKMTSCGRCYATAKKAIIENILKDSKNDTNTL